MKSSTKEEFCFSNISKLKPTVGDEMLNGIDMIGGSDPRICAFVGGGHETDLYVELTVKTHFGVNFQAQESNLFV